MSLDYMVDGVYQSSTDYVLRFLFSFFLALSGLGFLWAYFYVLLPNNYIIVAKSMPGMPTNPSAMLYSPGRIIWLRHLVYIT